MVLKTSLTVFKKVLVNLLKVLPKSLLVTTMTKKKNVKVKNVHQNHKLTVKKVLTVQKKLLL